MKEDKTVLTEQLRKKNNTKENLGFLKFLLFELTPLSTIKTLLCVMGLILFCIPTMGVPIFLYEEFQDRTFSVKGIELNLGIILTVGYVALEIIVGFIIYRRIEKRKMPDDIDETL